MKEKPKFEVGDYVEVVDSYMPTAYQNEDILRIDLITYERDHSYPYHYHCSCKRTGGKMMLVYDHEIQKTFLSAIEGANYEYEKHKTKNKKEEQI